MSDATKRWAAALERVARIYDEGHLSQAEDLRRAIAIGVRSEHEARLVLAALGWASPDAVDRTLFEEEGDE